VQQSASLSGLAEGVDLEIAAIYRIASAVVENQVAVK
jgi:hypothetical protein